MQVVRRAEASEEANAVGVPMVRDRDGLEAGQRQVAASLGWRCTMRMASPPAVRAAQQELFRLHAEGRVKPLISERLPLAQAPQAMAKVASRASIGKLILNP
ncbi:MAG: hypothetical protein NVS4B10_02080 [Myxococcales bacterium]